MAAGYGFDGPAVRLGRPFVDPAAPDTAVEVAIPLGFLNRHGLIAGATGTGKTRTLQLIAEQVAAAGCAGVRGRHEGRPGRHRRARRLGRAAGGPRDRARPRLGGRGGARWSCCR